jgi:hypothetical protein
MKLFYFSSFFIPKNYLHQVFLVINLRKIFILLGIVLFLIIGFALGTLYPELLFADSGDSVLELDG